MFRYLCSSMKSITALLKLSTLTYIREKFYICSGVIPVSNVCTGPKNDVLQKLFYEFRSPGPAHYSLITSGLS